MRLALLMPFSLLLAPPVSAAMWLVDQGGGGHFTEIQAAVEASAPGDLIVVNAGVYEETVDFLGKDIVVRSAWGPTATIIRPPGGFGSGAVFDDGETRASVLHGFTLRDGSGTDHLGTLRGGGAFCVGASPTFRNCHFVENHAGYAGAVYVREGADATFRRCVFRSNRSDSYGGAIGGIGQLVVEECLFENNSSVLDGTFYVIDACRLERCVFRGNEARQGAGIEAGAATSDHLIRDCWFEDNVSRTWHGAGVRVHEASPTIDGCVFVRNRAQEDGAAIMALDGGVTTVSNCTFWRNESGRYGGTMAAWYGSTILVTRSIFAATHRLPATFCNAAGRIEFEENIFWNNTVANTSGDCLDPVGVNGNFTADPFFCDPVDGDLRVAVNSPCLPANNPLRALVGALGRGCGPVALTAESWARVKARYR